MSPEMALSPGRSLGTTLDCPVLRHIQKPRWALLCSLAFTPKPVLLEVSQPTWLPVPWGLRPVTWPT